MEADYTARVRNAFPDPVLRAICRGVVDGYSATPAACKKALDVPDRHDAFGMIRRGKINEQLRGAAERHSLKCVDEPNSKGSAYFTSIFSGDLRLVACLVGRRESMVRPAKIRKFWARHNRDGRRMRLFPVAEDEIPRDAKYVAFLIHGPSGRRRDQPYFIDIVIPDADFRTYMCRLKLLSLFPEVAIDMAKANTQARKQPKPRKIRRQKDNIA